MPIFANSLYEQESKFITVHKEHYAELTSGNTIKCTSSNDVVTPLRIFGAEDLCWQGEDNEVAGFELIGCSAIDGIAPTGGDVGDAGSLKAMLEGMVAAMDTGYGALSLVDSAAFVVRVNAEEDGYELHELVKADVGLGAVENTALSTWAGTTNITTIGALSSLTLTVGNDPAEPVNGQVWRTAAGLRGKVGSDVGTFTFVPDAP